ncbi:hypothetical protein OM076_44120 [Solirubrobacter ginsenosidimutans]|uniref:Uncharacterized protein n=1 Tax=Solirubrobacter ginsenosidimutans TaxID=490573 RepID=A0A9X3N2I6_9ACTN|nr:hypothetical protein [Solirubrobacter ginsenosidimutans]MDA0167329.1 hypothetical protein [Solirubrobacter ginsenosidimutans]
MNDQDVTDRAGGHASGERHRVRTVAAEDDEPSRPQRIDGDERLVVAVVDTRSDACRTPPLNACALGELQASAPESVVL